MEETILTEKLNPNTYRIDLANSLEIVTLINNEDKTVALAVEKELIKIAIALDIIVDKLSSNGNMIYFGAGTSGRLGVLDSSECPPTFSVPEDLIRAHIAGGDIALRKAVEGAEDHFDLGEKDFLKANATYKDVIVGISASGNAPYVCGALSEAKRVGAATIGLTCNKHAKLIGYSDVHICTEVGPEVIAGSTRLKAGTAHKMVLNMLTTGAMIKLGKTYHNYMIDVKPTNNKLISRAVKIIQNLTGVNECIAREYLFNADKNVKIATVMIRKNVTKLEAKRLLDECNGKLRLIID